MTDKLTAEDRAGLRSLSGLAWLWDGRTINLGMVLDAWADAEERAMHAPSDLDSRVEAFLSANLPTDSDTLTRALATLRAQEAKGRAKYGTDLDTASLSARQVLQHATEEAADLLMYLIDLARRLDTMEEDFEWHRQFGEDMKRDRGVAEARVAELEAELTHARGLLADLRRPYLPDGTARAVEAAADAYLAGKPMERTIGEALTRLEELESESAPNNAEPAPTTRSGTGELLAEGRDYQIRTTTAAPGTEPPVPCVCGALPSVSFFGSISGEAWCVVCRRCERESGGYTTRAGALAGWADVVAKGREVTP